MRNLFVVVFAVAPLLSCQKQSKNVEKQKANKLQGLSAFSPAFMDSLYLDTLDHYLSQTDFSDCDNVEAELKKVYVRDQRYRDSLHAHHPESAEAKRPFSKEMQKSDDINEKILEHIFRNPEQINTCQVNEQAVMGFWYATYHSFNVKLKLSTLGYIDKAFKDSALNPELYAFLMDNIYVMSGRKQLYGTYPGLGKRGFPFRTSISVDSVNLERELIGLKKVEYD